MSTTACVYGVIKDDPEWEEKLDIIRKCMKLSVNPPPELAAYLFGLDWEEYTLESLLDKHSQGRTVEFLSIASEALYDLKELKASGYTHLLIRMEF